MLRFWIVMADRPVLQSTIRHINRSEAKQEAIRLAGKNPETKFFLAAVTGVAQTTEVSWTELLKPSNYDE